MKKVLTVIFRLFLIGGLLSSLAMAQTATVIKPTAKIYTKPNVKLKAAQILKRGRTVKLQSAKPVRGWYQVTVVSNAEPQNKDEALEAFMSEFDIYWIQASDIQIKPQNDVNEKDKWIYLYGDNIETTFFNREKIQNKDSQLISFWLKSVIIDKKAYWNKIVEELNVKPMRSNQAQSEDSNFRKAEDVSHTMLLYRANCRGLSLALQAFYTYSIKGDIWWSSEVNSPLKTVIPDSNGELIVKALCKNSPKN